MPPCELGIWAPVRASDTGPGRATGCRRGWHSTGSSAKGTKPSQGEIIAVGPGGRDEAGKLIPIDLKVGDRVLFGKWSGTEIKLDGVEYLIMKESDIMGVIDEPVAKRKAA